MATLFKASMYGQEVSAGYLNSEKFKIEALKQEKNWIAYF